MELRPLRRVIKILGSQKRISTSLGVSRKTVNGWLNQFKQMPLHHAMRLEELTDGKVLAEELIPHLKDHIISFQKYVIRKHQKYL